MGSNSTEGPAREPEHMRSGSSNAADRSMLGLEEIDQTQVALVGGKAAHLGELTQIDGVHVLAGFCVTTTAFRRIMAQASSIDDRLDRLSRLNSDDREGIRTLSAEIAVPSKGSPLPMMWRRTSIVRSHSSVGLSRVPCGPARPQRTCRRPQLPGSKTRT